jgi:uncharacterized protein (DUF1697 family)
MPITIALLRSINVGGKNKIKMDTLRAIFEAQGAQHVKTYIQSGNVVFQHEDGEALAQSVKHALHDEMGLNVPIITRTLPQWQALLEAHPFTTEQLATPKFAHIVLCQQAPSSEAIQALHDAHEKQGGRETIHIQGQEVYVFYTDGAGRSKLTLSFMEKKLSVVGTARNWNTMQKLLTMAEGLGE